MKFAPWIIATLTMTAAMAAVAAPAATLTGDIILENQVKESQRRENLITKHNALSMEERERRVAKSEQEATKARVSFKTGDIRSAAKSFSRAHKLNPGDDQIYYELGVALYKGNASRRALSILNGLDSTSVNQTELRYYLALINFKLKQDEQALVAFKDVREDNDPLLSPLASMYAGIIEKSQEKYTEAKASFEYVLDKSQDPKLDDRAEANIEDIIRLEQFKSTAGRKWNYQLWAGAGYDGNVLNIATNNSTTDVAAYRAQYGGLVGYRAINKPRHLLTPQFMVSDIYSVSEDFDTDSTIQSTDPLQAELSLPYRYTFRNSTTTLSLVPSYQVLYMSLDEGSRELIFNSFLLSSTVSTNHAEDWISDYRLEISKDTSHITVSNPADDQSALRYSFLFSQTKLIDDEGRKTFVMDLMFTKNNADGENSAYNKFTIGLGGGFPWSSSVLGFTKVDLFGQNYSDSSTDRKDKGVVLSLGAYYGLSTRSSLTFNLQYYMNDSNVAQYEYDKVVFTTLYSFNSGFF